MGALASSCGRSSRGGTRRRDQEVFGASRLSRDSRPGPQDEVSCSGLAVASRLSATRQPEPDCRYRRNPASARRVVRYLLCHRQEHLGRDADFRATRGNQACAGPPVSRSAANDRVEAEPCDARRWLPLGRCTGTLAETAAIRALQVPPWQRPDACADTRAGLPDASGLSAVRPQGSIRSAITDSRVRRRSASLPWRPGASVMRDCRPSRGGADRG